MKRLLVTVMGGVSSLLTTQVALAAPPAWCKGASADQADLRGLSSKDVREVIKTFVRAECSPTPEVEDHRGEIEAARQAWGKRLGMAEADWADAVVYASAEDYSIKAELSAKTLATATPLDQYGVIKKSAESFSEFDTLYAADMFDANLTEAGRLAFLQTTCLNRGDRAEVNDQGMTGTEVIWAICEADLERFDVAKLLGELRADTAHDGAIKMKLRIAAYELPRQIKDHAAEVGEMLKRDDANKKLFEVAKAARTEWASGLGKNAKLLDLVLAMDSAMITQSRKQLEGCSETTAAALADAVATIPAKAFAGMVDKRGDATEGFAGQASPVLAQSPAVTLAAIAALRCTHDGELAELLDQLVDHGPPSRGPRNMALAKIMNTKITYDKVGAKLKYPASKPYGTHYQDGAPQARSMGGPVKAIKPAGDTLRIEFQKATMTSVDCVRSHNGRMVRIRDNGSIEYESICDKTEKQIHDITPQPVSVSAKYAAWLKPGVVVSHWGKEVIAVWPSASAKLPSMVLGGAVK